MTNARHVAGTPGTVLTAAGSCRKLVAVNMRTPLLVGYASGSRPAGLVGRVVYAFGSYHRTHLLGQANLLASEWLPAYALCQPRRPGSASWRPRKCQAQTAPYKVVSREWSTTRRQLVLPSAPFTHDSRLR